MEGPGTGQCECWPAPGDRRHPLRGEKGRNQRPRQHREAGAISWKVQGTAEEGEAQVQEGPTPGRMAVGQTLNRAVLAGPQLTGGEGAELLSLGAPGKVRTRAGQHPAVRWPRTISRRQRRISHPPRVLSELGDGSEEQSIYTCSGTWDPPLTSQISETFKCSPKLGSLGKDKRFQTRENYRYQIFKRDRL